MRRGAGRGPGPGPGCGTGGLLRRLRDSETRRLELERKLVEYKKSDAYLIKLKYMKLKKYLEEIDERQKRALLRNQAILKELNQFEAHMKTSSSELIQKMEWYGREIKSALSLQEGSLSARGDEEEYNKQNPWVVRPAGIHSGTAMSRGLYHPATIFMGHHMSAAWSMQQKASHAAESHSVPEPCSHRQAALSSDETGRCFPRVGSDMPCTNKPDKQDAKADVLVWEKMPITSGVALAESSMRSSLTNLTERRNPAECRSLSPNRGSVESRTADLNSDISVEEEDVTREHLVASAEDKQPVPVAFVPEPGISEEDQESIPGPQDGLSNGQPSQAVSEDSSSEPLVCAGKGMLMAAGSRTWAGGTHPAEVFSPQPSSPCAAEEEPLGSLAADGYVLAIPSPAGQYLSQRCPQMSFQATEDSWLCSLAVPQQSHATAGIAASCALKAIITLCTLLFLTTTEIVKALLPARVPPSPCMLLVLRFLAFGLAPLICEMCPAEVAVMVQGLLGGLQAE